MKTQSPFKVIDKLTISANISINNLINWFSKLLHGRENYNDIYGLRSLEHKLIKSGEYELAERVRELIYDLKFHTIKLKEPKNVLISTGIGLDSKNQAYLKAGAGVYSGMTGELLFIVNNHLKFPFDRNKLERSITNVKALFKDNNLYENNGVNFENKQIEFAPLVMA